MADFASEYGIRLATADMSWREFLTLLIGLLAVESRLCRHFTTEHQDEGSQP